MARHPDVRLQLSTCAFEWDFDESSADVGLVYCPEVPGPEYRWVPLFEYTLKPVCSPALAARLGPAPTAAQLLDLPLVEIYSEQHNWDIWFETAQLQYSMRPAIVVDTLAVALEIALEGRGVALVNGPLCRGRPGRRPPGATRAAPGDVPGRLGRDLPPGRLRSRTRESLHGLARRPGSADSLQPV